MLRELLAPGDTYEKYTRRCEATGITPKTFQEWMSFEAKMDHAGRRALQREVEGKGENFVDCFFQLCARTAADITIPLIESLTPMNCPSGGHEFTVGEFSRLLTPREIETVTLLLEGHSSNKEIAAVMGVTEQVIKNRFSRIYRKLGLRRRVDLIKFNSTELAGLQ